MTTRFATKNEWQQFTLGELCSLITDGKHGDCQDQPHSGFYFLSVKDILGNRLVYDNARQITEMDFSETHRRTNLQPGDILFTNTGTIGRIAIAGDDPRTYYTTFQKSVAILKARRELIEPDFLYYLLHFENARLSEFAAGTTQKNLLLKDIRTFEVEVPPLPEQRAIAHVLGTLDDKIELNQRMNRTLEEMARAVFKDWFVDFGPTRAKMEGQEPYLPPELWDLFPDELVDSELGEVPEGWDIVRIEDVAERVAMGPFGSSIKVSTFVNSGVPIISGQHLNGMLLEDRDYRFITQDHADRLARSNVQQGDIVFTHAGNIGQTTYIPSTAQYDRYIISQRQFYLRCDTSKISPLFVVHFFKTPEGRHQLLANTSSTGVPSIARPVSYLRSIMFCMPPKDLWTVWDKATGGFYRAVARNNREIITLASQRDAILPKLVSGKIQVAETKITESA